MSLSSWTYDKKYCIQKPHSKDAKKNDGDGMWRIFLIPEMDLFEDFKFINSTPIRPHVKLPLKCQCLEPKKKNWTCFSGGYELRAFFNDALKIINAGMPQRSHDKNQPLETQVSIYFEEKTAETSPERGTFFKQSMVSNSKAQKCTW